MLETWTRSLQNVEEYLFEEYFHLQWRWSYCNWRNSLYTWDLRWVLNFIRSERKIAKDNSKTSQTFETPFLERATQRYCFTADMNISLDLNNKVHHFPSLSSVQPDLNTGPAFWTTERISWRERTFDLNSWDLGSGGPSGRGFMDSLHSDLQTDSQMFSFWPLSYLNIKKASFW